MSCSQYNACHMSLKCQYLENICQVLDHWRQWRIWCKCICLSCFIILTNATILCPIPQDNCIYQTSDALVDPDSMEKQFTVLRYHVTCNNGARINNKIMCGKALRGAALPSTPPWISPAIVSHSNPGLDNFINQCKCKTMCDSVYMIQKQCYGYQCYIVQRL